MGELAFTAIETANVPEFIYNKTSDAGPLLTSEIIIHFADSFDDKFSMPLFRRVMN